MDIKSPRSLLQFGITMRAIPTPDLAKDWLMPHYLLHMGQLLSLPNLADVSPNNFVHAILTF